MADDDADSIRKSLKDPERFAALVDRHGTVIWRYLARRAGAHTADDVLADVFTAAFSRRSSYAASHGDARPWLYGIARNCLLAHWRRERSTVGPPFPSADDDPWPAVDERLDAAQCAPALRQALASLPPDERDVLLLVAWEQLSPTEAAAALGIPAGTARSRLHRARTALKLALPPTLEMSP